MFVGEYKHTIDEKNRIFIPSRLRSELGERFMVTKGFDRCLFVFPMAKWEAFAAKIAALPMVKNRRERLYFFSNAAECTLDSQGRVTVSPLLKEFAGIVKDVTVVGNDTIGIIARVSAALAAHNANILDISQTVLSGMFNMMMIVDVSLSDFDTLSAALSALGAELGLQVRIQRSEIFDAMHRI